MPRAEHCSHANNLPHASSSTIAFYGSRLHSWDSYVAGKGYLGGEAYWAAGIDYVLRRLGFDIVYRNTSTPDAPSDFAMHFNAFVLDSAFETNSLFMKVRDEAKMAGLSVPGALCRTRILHFFGNWHPSIKLNSSMVNEHSVLTPYTYQPYELEPDLHDVNAPVPLFPHSLVTMPPSTNASRERQGFVLGKSCDYFAHPTTRPDETLHVLGYLHGFKLHMHARCDGRMKYLERIVPQKPVFHGSLSPSNYVTVLRQMAFLVGLGSPPDPPSVLEALANGVAFLNPILTEWEANRVHRRGDTKLTTPYVAQHRPFASLGPPYVYSFDPHNWTSIGEAAEKALANRFASFVPPAHTIDAVTAAVCAHVVSTNHPYCEKWRREIRI